MDILKRWFFKLTNNIPLGHSLYYGDYQGGKAVFTYIPSDGDPLPDGDFRYRQTDGEKCYTRQTGRMAMGVRCALWRCERKDGQRLVKATIGFKNGKPEGEFAVISQLLANDEHSVIFSHISNGRLTGRIVANLLQTDVIGHCDANGSPIGKWQMKDMSVGTVNEEYHSVEPDSAEVRKFLKLANRQVGIILDFLKLK